MEYYMTMKMNELKPHATAQINLTCDSEGKKRKKKNQDTKEYTLRDSIHLKSKKIQTAIYLRDAQVSFEF